MTIGCGTRQARPGSGSVTTRRNFMRDQMRVGDRAFFYHSACPEPVSPAFAKCPPRPIRRDPAIVKPVLRPKVEA
jgi:hypothetical protein